MNEASNKLREKFTYIANEYQIPFSSIVAVRGVATAAVVTSMSVPFFLGAVFCGSDAKKKDVKKKLTSSDVPDDLLSINREKFYQMLCKHCDQLGYSEVQLYDKACVSKAVYSNIRSMSVKGKTYVPSKHTVMCLCIALHLSVSQAQEMLNLVGYSFSNNVVIDKIIAWCLEQTTLDYDVRTINDVIYEKIGESPFLKLN